MDFITLEIFRAVWQEKSVTRAARRLNRAQSNVSTRLQQLEFELGTTLFRREGKRMVVTEQGEILAGYAEQLLSLVEEARQMMHPLTASGRLRVGSMESTAASRLPKPLSRFRQRHPQVTLELSTNTSAALTEAVLDRRLDCALVAPFLLRSHHGWETLQADARLETTPVFQEYLFLVLPAKHPVIRSPQQLQVQTLACFAPGCSYRAIAENWIRTDSTSPLKIQTIGSYHAMLACISAGGCFGVVPQSVLATVNPLGVNAQPLIKIDTWLIRRHDFTTPAFDAFLETLTDVVSRNEWR